MGAGRTCPESVYEQALMEDLRRLGISYVGQPEHQGRPVGLGRAEDMIMGGSRVSAREAEAWGPIMRAVPRRDWQAAGDELAQELMRLSPRAFVISTCTRP